jgi:hypothetical protein
LFKKLIGGLTFRFDSLKNLAGVYNAYCLGQLKGLKKKKKEGYKVGQDKTKSLCGIKASICSWYGESGSLIVVRPMRSTREDGIEQLKAGFPI